MPPITAALGSAPLLGPLVALNVWTLGMEAWMYAGRIPAINKATAERGLKLEPKMTKEQLNSYIPIETRWKADNYNHLLEQPTNFYAVVLALQYLGVQDPLTVGLAWGYVGVRVVHSLVQAITNKIMLRLGLFAISSFVLAGLTAKSAQVLFF